MYTLILIHSYYYYNYYYYYYYGMHKLHSTADGHSGKSVTKIQREIEQIKIANKTEVQRNRERELVE